MDLSSTLEIDVADQGDEAAQIERGIPTDEPFNRDFPVCDSSWSFDLF
jgi:hypothetical protein